MACLFFSLSKSLAAFAPAGVKKVRIMFGGMAQAFSNTNPAQRSAFGERAINKQEDFLDICMFL